MQFCVDDPALLLAEHRKWDAQYAAPLKNQIRQFANNRGRDRRLRIGYVSPDFRRNVLALMTSALLPHHNHEQFEIYCYSRVQQHDAGTARLRTHADVWRTIKSISDGDAADVIRADGIDILMDMTMHMSDCRPLLFARKPAPIQVAWLAYPGTTGLSTMDYRITDPYLDPPEFDTHYTEKSFRLQNSFWCYDPYGMACEDQEVLPEPGELPASKNGFITFGCLNDFSKVNIGTLKRWGRLMQGVERSHLRLLAPRGRCRGAILEHLEPFGVTADRIEFVERQPRSAYLAEYQRIDLCLETLPYNSHTTSLDAFWMGVPVLTQIGRTVVGRAGFSMLTNLQLPDFCAEDDDQFIELGRRWSSNLPALAEIRRTLRERMSSSPLMDAPLFAQNMEAAYREMWQRWCEAQER
jgi:predicted O-linked N-acetylglucosamine transferase (SPINDLY family)